METPYGEIPDKFAKDMSPQEMHDFLKRKYSRRTMLKAAGALGAVAVVGPTIWKQSSASATGLPIPQWIAFGPNPATSMYISWSAGSYNNPNYIASSNPGAAPSPQVQYGLDATYGAKLAATANNVPIPASGTYGAQPAANIDDTLYVTTLIQGLTPETTYHYSVSFDGVNWGPDTTFTTGKTGVQNYRFVGTGDMNSYAPNTTTFADPLGGNYGTINAFNVGNGGSSYYVAQGIGALGGSNPLVPGPAPDFVIFAGDLSYASGGVTPLGDTYGLSAGNTTQSTYAPVDWDYFLSMIGGNLPGTAQNVPWMFGVGNHEMEPLTEDGYAGILTRFNQNYATNSGGPVNQTWTYGNVAFIQLDGNDLSAEISNNNGYTNGQQTAWLTSLLAQYRSPGSNVDFIVCYFHNCMFCTNQTHGSDSGVRTIWEPIFDQYGVDLVVNGHVHAYERTYPLVGGIPQAVVASGGTVNNGSYASGTPFASKGGVTYICSGNGGQSLYTNWYGVSGGGDNSPTSGGGQSGTVATTTEPLTNTWSGTNSAKGGTGSSQDVSDYPSGQSSTYYLSNPYSAYRHGNWGFIVVDVTAPTSSNPSTSLHIQAVSPSGIVSSSDSAVADSVTITRTSNIPAANLPEFAKPALVVGGALALAGGAYVASKRFSRREALGLPEGGSAPQE